MALPPGLWWEGLIVDRLPSGGVSELLLLLSGLAVLLSNVILNEWHFIVTISAFKKENPPLLVRLKKKIHQSGVLAVLFGN